MHPIAKASVAKYWELLKPVLNPPAAQNTNTNKETKQKGILK